MAKPMSRQDLKAEALARDGVLNPHPEGVRDPLFNDNPFFDPRDLVQVRYEMVRRHQNDGIAITDVAENFGVSRPTFYKAQGALTGQGLAGLVPRQRGPKGGHKISAEVLSFVDEAKAASPELTLPQVIGMIAERFGRDVHRRSLERALARKKNSLPLPRRSRRRGHKGLRAAARRSAWRRTDPGRRIGHHAT
jgi:transposase